MGKPEGKRPLEKPRCRWEYNIKNVHGEIGWGVMDWRTGSFHILSN
jgi:hypothetical protein